MNDELLVKYLTDNCTEAELQEVELWLDGSVEHQNRLDELRKLWGYTEVEQNYDVDLAWQNLSQRIKEVESPSGGIVRNLFAKRTSYIAAAAAVLIAAIFITNKLTNDTKTLQAKSNAPSETILSDGSKIAVNAGSSITYPRSFGSDQRLVELVGEAFFDVERDTERPFIVRTKKGEVEVFGTSFKLEEKGDSLLLLVTEGIVALRPIYDTVTTKDQMFTAGQQGFLDYRSGKIYRSIETSADALFWYNQSLVFESTPLPEVLRVLEKNYNVRFQFEFAEIKECLLTTKFESERLEDIIAVIETTFGISIQLEKNQYQVISDEKQCADS